MAMDKIWKISEPDRNTVDSIEKEHDLSKVLATVLVNRGITDNNDIDRFLNPSVESFHDPFLLKDMHRAVDRVLLARDNCEQLCIYGDYDVDGVTSTSVLYMFLKEIGCEVTYYIPDRHEEGYGINSAALEKVHNEGATLVISVDTGITAGEQAEFAKVIGLDLIITDHHECGPTLPDAYAIINPKQPTCSYPFKQLAGCGVTFKLIHGLAKKLEKEEAIYKYLDIVAVGTVADIVPLVDENRIIVKTAFKTMFNTWNLGLKALLDVADVKEDKITAGIIGFRVGPRLNAAGRLGDAKRCVKLFTSPDIEEVRDIAKELDEENKLRQSIEHDMFDETDRIIKETIDVKNNKVLVIAGNEWNHGVIGIVASRVTEKYYRPTILLTVKDGIASGSARSVEGFNIFEALSDSRELFEKFGGHEMAAGMSLKAENVPILAKALNDYATIHMAEDTLIEKVKADMALPISAINQELVESISEFEPYGMGNAEPKFMISGELAASSKIGGDKTHLRLSLKEEWQKIDGIGFRFGEYHDYIIDHDPINVIATLGLNHWNNKTSVQLMIKDIKIDHPLYKRLEEAFRNVEKFQSDLRGIREHETRELKIKTIGKQYDIVLPSRKQYEKIYRSLIAYDKRQLSKVYMQNFIRDAEISDHIGYTQMFLILKVFEELSLMTYEVTKYYIDFSLIKGKKVELTESKLYNDMSYIL